MDQEEAFMPHHLHLQKQPPTASSPPDHLPEISLTAPSPALSPPPGLPTPIARPTSSFQPLNAGFKSFLLCNLPVAPGVNFTHVPLPTRPPRIPSRTAQEHQTQCTPSPLLALVPPASVNSHHLSTCTSPKPGSLFYRHLLLTESKSSH